VELLGMNLKRWGQGPRGGAALVPWAVPGSRSRSNRQNESRFSLSRTRSWGFMRQGQDWRYNCVVR
jgi:hypothetical protein